MNNSKKTRRALLSSVIALMLCFSMLVGTTMAWFTDTATTGVNKIVSGTLDIDIVNTEGDSLAGKELEFYKSSIENEEVLWEPGATYYATPFKIKNKGNLDAKYQIVVNGGTGDTVLLDAIDFYLSMDNKIDDKDTEVEFVDASKDIDQTKGEKLEAKAETETMYLIGEMKEEAGNQYQGKTITGVSITVYATQQASEYDSFNNTYDEDAKYSEIPTADVTHQDGGDNGIVVQKYVSGSGDLVQTEAMTMDCIYTFKATDSVSTVAANEYENWKCDYYISFDKDVAADAGSIAGSYQGWNNGAWLEMTVPEGGITAGNEIALLQALEKGDLGTETTWTYGAICTIVSEFQCGVVKGHQESLNGTTMTVELRMTNPDTAEVIVINSIQYTFE